LYILKKEPEDFVVKEVMALSTKQEGRYAYFLMKKRDHTTMGALQLIARRFHIPLKRIGFAGTKDKRAVTEQIISITEGTKRFEQLRIKDVELIFLGRGDRPISLGLHQGNQFEIVVRNVETVPKKMNTFINYFGKQRFSTQNIAIGRAIIKKQFKEAVEIIIKDDKKYGDILSFHLDERKNDYVGALRKIPKKILTLYVHAYQSGIWNAAVKQLLEKKNRVKTIPLVGFGTEFESKEVKNILTGLLEKDDITKEDFVIRAIPELSSEGAVRDVYVKVKNLEITDLKEKKVRADFFLSKGCYATTFIEQLFAQ